MEAYLSGNCLEIGRAAALGLLVAVLLVGYVLVDFVVGEDGGLGLENLHGGGAV